MRKVMKEEVHYTYLDSPSGRLGLAANNRGLVALDFIQANDVDYKIVLEKRFPRNILVEIRESSPNQIITEVKRQLKEYFTGERRQFTCPLDLAGTAFQKKVWQALQEIPYGETVSYEDIARKIGNIKAVRAVGQANGKNPVSIIVPCHRVVRKSGDLGGYSSGLPIKKFLLNWEEKIKNG